MSYKDRPPEQVIDYFEALGFKYKVVTDSIFTDKRDAPVHYFQSDDADGFNYCSTIMADDAVRLFKNVKEPFNKKVERAFGARCSNGHLLMDSDCSDCKKQRREAKKLEVVTTNE